MNSAISTLAFAKAVLAAVVLTASSMGQATTNWSATVGDFLDGSNSSTSLASNVTGWSTTGAGATYQTACLHDYGATNGYGVVNQLESANQTFNVCDTTAGPHAADNGNGVDAFLLQFASAVSLTQIKIGWNGTDNYSAGSDISVLKYTGTGAPVSFAGKTVAQLLNSGWQLVGNYGQVGALANNTALVNGGTSSSWWLISAYNSAFGSAGVSSSGLAITSGTDYFKLLSVAGTTGTTTNQTPEPGSLALAAMGLICVIGLSRWRSSTT